MNWKVNWGLRTWHPYALLTYIIVFLFGPSLFFDYVCYDDNVLIRDQVDFLNHPSNVGKVFTQHYFAPVSQGGRYYRPLVTLSYMTDTWIGGGKPWTYHATNVALHIAVTCLFFLLLRIILVNASVLPFLGALLFAVHPLQTMAIAWIPGRNDMLLALFLLIGLLAFIRHHETGRTAPLAIHLAAFFMGLLSKESAILLPVICAGWVWLVKAQSSPRRLFQALPIYAWTTLLIVWLCLRTITLGMIVERNPVPAMEPASLILTLCGLLLRYFEKVIFPVNLALLPDIEESTILYGSVSLLLAILALWRSEEPPRRLILFGLIAGLLFLALSVPFPDRMAARNLGLLEHRMYLPLGFFILVLLAGLLRFKFTPLLLIVFALVLTGITHERLPAFSNMSSFWIRAIHESPRSSDAWHNYGCVQAEEKQYVQAEKAFVRALELNPHRVMSHLNLAYIYNKQERYSMAIDSLFQELNNDPFSPKAFEALALNYEQSGDPDRAREWSMRAKQAKQPPF